MSGTALDFTDHISKSTTSFTGRDWVFKAINDWLTDPNGSRYFLLTGMPGSGKTAIAAHLVQFSLGISPPAGCDRLAAGALSAWHFCSARDTEWFDPRTFAGTLASQLAARYPLFRQALWQKRYEDRNITISSIQNVGQMTGGQMTGMNITVNVGNIPPLDAFSRVVREPLMALFAEEPTTCMVILVDALDEALLYGATESIPWLLSKIDNLPKGARFILTSRKVERIEHYFRTATSLFLSAKSFTKYNLEDIRRYIQERLLHDDALQAAVSTVSAVQMQRATVEVTRKAAGNFLYIRFLLDSIALGTRSLDQLDGLPKGLDALYFDSLQRVLEQGKGDWHKDYVPLMGVLAVAQESLTQIQLEALSGQKASIIRQHLGALQPFFEHVDVKEKKQEKKYRLYHQSIIDFFDSPLILGEKKKAVVKKEEAEDEMELGEIEDDDVGEGETEKDLDNTFYLSLKGLHSEMARRCEQGGISDIWANKQDDEVEQSRREYARKYYVVHLYHGDREKEQERLFAVLDEGEYGRAKIKHDFNTLAYARDLELGQQATMRNELSNEKKINLLPVLWRYSLLRCSLGTQADSYPDSAFLVMVMLFQHQRAIAALELLSDEHRKVRLLISIGVKIAEQGQKNLAQEALVRVKDVLATNVQSDPALIQTALQVVVEVRPFALEVPFLSEIATIAQLIEDEELRTSALVVVAVAFAQAEAREKAEALASTIPYTDLDEETREQIVETLVKAQLWESATLIAQSILDDQRTRNRTLAEVIIGLLRVQKWEKARELALTTDPSDRFKAMAEIALARVLVEPHMVEALLQELATVPLASDQHDDREHAKDVTSQIWARAQQWDKAIAIVQNMHDDFGGNWTVSKVLKQMLMAQRWDKALELVSSLQSSFQQLELLDSLVKALIDGKQVNNARDAIVKVVQAISQREQNEKKPDDEVLLRVVTLLITLQLWDDAQQVIGQMKSSTQQCQALVTLADALSQEQPARAGQLILRAESIAFSLKQPGEEAYGSNPERTGSILSTVVGVLARLQLWDRAITLANTIATRWSTSDRDEAFAAIVAALSQVEIWDRALSIAQNIQDEEEQSRVLKAVVEDMLYLQEWQRALEAVQTIKGPKQRFEALIALIKRLIAVQWMPLVGRTELSDKEDELPLISLDVQLSQEGHLWDTIITTAQQSFEEYRPAAIIAELLQNLALAEQWDRALKIADIPILKERRAEILLVIISYMMGAEQRERALALARSIDVPAQKAEALTIIVAAHLLEQPELAEVLLNEALAVAQAITDEEPDRSAACASLALQLNKAGRWEKALEIARSMHEPSERNKALIAIATTRIDIDLEQAITILNEALVLARTPNEEDQEQLLSDIADVLPRLPPIKQTYAFRVELLACMAIVLRASEAVEVAARLDALAVAIAHAEHEEQFRTLWEGFENLVKEVERNPLWNPYAVENLEENTEAEDSIAWKYWSSKDEQKDKLLRLETWNSLQNGQAEQAATLLLEHMASKCFFNEYEWSTLQRDVAGSLARKHQWEKALAIAWSIHKEWQKTQALIAIATTLVHAGQREKGQLLLLEAEAIVHSIKDDKERDHALVDVAEALTEIQELDDAEVVVEFIKDALQAAVKGTMNTSSYKDRPRLLITRALARAQRWDEAKEEARRIGGFLKIRAMNSITDAMITCGKHEQALLYIQTAWVQAEARRELLKLLPFAEEFIPLHPELGEALYKSFTWVDQFLQA